jgi:SnoaL-like polyketide cyclase
VVVPRPGQGHTRAVAFDVGKLLRLWTEPLPPGAAAEDAFREVYADPVTVNGAPLTAADMVARARTLQAALTDVERTVLDVVDDGSRVAVAFRLRGRHVGTLATAAGPLAPTGAVIDLRVVDVLVLAAGRVATIWMAADELGALTAAGVVRLVAQEP